MMKINKKKLIIGYIEKECKPDVVTDKYWLFYIPSRYMFLYIETIHTLGNCP